MNAAGKVTGHARFNGRSPSNYRPMNSRSRARGGRGKLFESREIAECVRLETALMRAKPRCGHGASFSKEREGQAANCLFEAAGSGNLATFRRKIARSE
jgi:hypothetical protein